MDKLEEIRKALTGVLMSEQTSKETRIKLLNIREQIQIESKRIDVLLDQLSDSLDDITEQIKK